MTARAGTEVEAANLALGHLRQPTIANLTDDNTRARAVKLYYATARDAALRLRWWNFATGWTQPAKATAPRLGPRPNVFPLPPDCVDVRFVQDAEDDDWAVEAAQADPSGALVDVKVLVTVANITAPVVCYTRIIEAPRLWEPDFTLAFSYLLASLAGNKIGTSATRIKELKDLADGWRDDATQADGLESAPTQVSRNTSWLASRRRGGSVTS